MRYRAMQVHLPPAERKKQILQAAIELTLEYGYRRFLRKHIALHLNISESLVNRYYSTMNSLHIAVMQEAIKKEILSIIAEGLCARDKTALRASAELKTRALKNLIKN